MRVLPRKEIGESEEKKVDWETLVKVRWRKATHLNWEKKMRKGERTPSPSPEHFAIMHGPNDAIDI